MADPRVWFITGCSSGFGRELAEQALAAGHRVALTARKTETLADLVQQYPQTAQVFWLDVTDPKSIDDAIQAAIQHFGQLDVLVNNAGFGLLGALEECSDEQLERNLATNFLGPLRVMRAVLPHFRQRRAGRIINLSAAAALGNYAGFSVYGGAKAGLEMASDALRHELAPLGIHVTLVVPGPFRTDFIARSLENGAETIPDYEASVGKFRTFLRKIDGAQPGNPAKGAQAILMIAEEPRPPFRLALGRYAHDKIRKYAANLTQELDRWQPLGLPTDFEK